MTDTLERPIIQNPRYEVTGSFTIIRSLPIKTLFGLMNSHKALKIPDIPADAIIGETQLSSGGKTTEITTVTLDFLSSHGGNTFFQAYIESLKAFVAQHKIAIDNHFLMDCLSWSLDVNIKDSKATSGERTLNAFEILGIHQLENLVNALKSRSRSLEPLIVNNESDDYFDLEDGYLSIANYMLVDKETVTIHFYDFDDESTENAHEVLHKIELDRDRFANAMMRTYHQIKKCIDTVTKALGVDQNQLKLSIIKDESI